VIHLAQARFVARYGNYSVGVQSSSEERLGHDGKMVPARRRLDANFQNRLVSDDDVAVAVATFSFRGLPEDTDTNEHISPTYRLSVWDSEEARRYEGLSDDEVDLIIDALRKDVGYGQDHVEMTAPASVVPFPNYDDLSADEILQLLKLTGIDVGSVVAYERENQNRESLLRRLEGVEVDDDSVVVSAG
jgi:hypothetical protein